MDCHIDGWLVGCSTGVGVADGGAVTVIVGVLFAVDVVTGVSVTVGVGSVSR